MHIFVIQGKKQPMKTNRTKAIAKALTTLLPAIPLLDSEAIRKDATAPHMRNLPTSIAVWLATIAYVRHTYTDYDSLRDEGYDRDSARFFVLDAINEKLASWRATRYLDETDTD